MVLMITRPFILRAFTVLFFVFISFNSYSYFKTSSLVASIAPTKSDSCQLYYENTNWGNYPASYVNNVVGEECHILGIPGDWIAARLPVAWFGEDTCTPPAVYNAANDICLAPEVYDCYNSYNDLDLFADGIQCSCDGFMPDKLGNDANGGAIMTCDGVDTGCDPGEQKVTYTVEDNEPINGCVKIEVCDPLTDENQCDGNLEANPEGGACVTSDPNDPCLEDDFFDEEGNPPDMCLSGYRWNGEMCVPISKIETVVDEKTGETTQRVTTNNDGDTNNTTNHNNTTNNESGDEVKDEPEEEPEEEEPLSFTVPETSGTFDLVQATSDLSTVRTEFGSLINTIRSDGSVMFSLTVGSSSLPCYDFPLPYEGGVKQVCLSDYSSFFDIFVPVLLFIAYFVSLVIILRN